LPAGGGPGAVGPRISSLRPATGHSRAIPVIRGGGIHRGGRVDAPHAPRMALGTAGPLAKRVDASRGGRAGCPNTATPELETVSDPFLRASIRDGKDPQRAAPRAVGASKPLSSG